MLSQKSTMEISKSTLGDGISLREVCVFIAGSIYMNAMHLFCLRQSITVYALLFGFLGKHFREFCD